MSERTILEGHIISGFFSKTKLSLTNKRLIIEGKRSIDLTEILEVYTKREYNSSKLVLRLRSGEIIQYGIVIPKGSIGIGALFDSTELYINNVRDMQQSETNRWVNAINNAIKP